MSDAWLADLMLAVAECYPRAYGYMAYAAIGSVSGADSELDFYAVQGG